MFWGLDYDLANAFYDDVAERRRGKMTEMSLDTFINLYRYDHPEHTIRQAIEHLNELRADTMAKISYFDDEEGGFPIWDSGLEWVLERVDGPLFSVKFREYLVVEGCTEASGMGWPVQVRIPLKDWYKLRVVVF